jgi:hypothetical protein
MQKGTHFINMSHRQEGFMQHDKREISLLKQFCITNFGNYVYGVS